MTLSKKDILKKNTKTIFVKAFDGELNFRPLTARMAVSERGNKTDLELSFDAIAASIVDENNKPMFTAEEVKDFPLDAYTEISKIIAQLNNIKVESENLKNAQTEGSI